MCKTLKSQICFSKIQNHEEANKVHITESESLCCDTCFKSLNNLISSLVLVSRRLNYLRPLGFVGKEMGTMVSEGSLIKMSSINEAGGVYRALCGDG